MNRLFQDRKLLTRRRLNLTSARRRTKRNRAGAASMDYFLVLAIIVPLAAFMTFVVPRIIRLVYEMTVTMVGMPFM